MRVVYYGAAMGGRLSLIRRLCALGRDAIVHDDPGSVEEVELLWPRDDSRADALKLRATIVWSRLHGGAGCEPIENLVAQERSGELPYHTFSRGLEALRLAQAIIFVVDDLSHNFRREARGLDILRADLRATGRAPEDVPVVFQVLHPLMIMRDEDAYVETISTRSVQDPVIRQKIVATPPAEIVETLTWPRCAHIDDSLRDEQGTREAMNRAIALHEESDAGRQQRGTHEPE
jgi:hypothetical protein